MRRVRVLAYIVCLLLIAAAPALAQSKTPKSTKGSKTIALLDVNALFKADAGMKKQMEEMKHDVAQAEAEVKTQADAVKTMTELVEKDMPAGSPERDKANAELIKRKADVQVRVETQKGEFLKRESKIYNDVYQKIVVEVDKYAKENKIAIVLKFNGEPLNAGKPDDVLRVINAPVVWHADSIDITPIIAERLKQSDDSAAMPKVTNVVVASATLDGEKVDENSDDSSKSDKSKSDNDVKPKKTKKSHHKKKAAADKPKADESAKAPAKAADKQATKTAEKKPEVKKATVVAFTLKGNYPEGPTESGLFGEMQPSLTTLIQRMDQAAGDKNVAAVWLRIEDVEIGGGKIDELRAAVARIRKAGKPVYAELTGGDMPEYVLAAACNEIVMPQSGMLIVPGIHAEVTFYKGLLDKLGLKFDALQMGKYKGAAEPMTRTAMSGPLRESMEAIVDDSYEALVKNIAGDRRLKPYQVKDLLDQGLFSATTAKKAGLIDTVCYADEFQDSLGKKLKVDRVDVVTNYKKKHIDTDFSGVGGLMKLMELFSGAKPAEKAGGQKKIAVIYAVGEIVEGKSVSDMWGSHALGSTTLIESIRKASDDPKVVAVVLRVDSPGGSATASDLIWRETVRCKKPIIASMGNVAGSGGYYIAMAARKIVAEPSTITGSIGVIGGKLVTGGMYEKLGLTTEIISRGKNSGTLSSNQPFTADERKAWTELLTETYHQFVSKAAQGRKMDYEELQQLAQGRVYTGRMAKKLGLIDEVGTLQDAVALAKQAAGLKADAEVDLMVLPQPKSVFEQLFGDPSVSSDIESLSPEFFRMVRQAKVWRQMLREKTLLWMPYEVQIR